jgi:hypothetical protein
MENVLVWSLERFGKDKNGPDRPLRDAGESGGMVAKSPDAKKVNHTPV